VGAAALLNACDVAEPPATEHAAVQVSAAGTMGEWGDTFSTAIVALHASLVPLADNGVGVLVWGHRGEPHLWDLANPVPTFTTIGEPVELFCAGHTFLPDGSLLVAGGHDEVKGDGHGIPNAYRFVNGGWVTESPMSFARWYPTATTLENGDVIVYAGTDNDKVNVATPELYSYGSHTWTQLTGANKKYPYYPRSFLDPKNGRMFYAGEAKTSKWLDRTGNGGLGKWVGKATPRVVPDRNYGSAAMYEQGKILYAGGGGRKPAAGIPPTSTAEIIDLNQAQPQWTATGSMAYGRRQMNLTILADGQVLVNGGTSAMGFNNRSLPRKEPEIWNPATGAWTLVAPEKVIRVYHGTALLLPDGRVLSAGTGDGDSESARRETNGQIFSPPYLFDATGAPAPRPVISSISTAALHYGQSFTIGTPAPAAIAKVHLIRFSAGTHAFNQSQMLYRAAFTTGGGVLNVTGPANGRVAPPGPYLVFIVDQNGVPSLAKVMLLSQ
jgi:hypothetical protein